MFLIITFLNLFMSPATLYDFKAESPARDWRIVDDVVMGGRSSGNFEINAEGHGHFHGYVSLENNGGFSSVRNSDINTSVEGYASIRLRLKGDGKRYQLRIKDEASKRYSYIQYFETSGEWQEIDLPLADFYPSFRGQKLDLPNFKGSKIEEIAFLIANYKAEEFGLLIDWIQVQE